MKQVRWADAILAAEPPWAKASNHLNLRLALRLGIGLALRHRKKWLSLWLWTVEVCVVVRQNSVPTFNCSYELRGIVTQSSLCLCVFVINAYSRARWLVGGVWRLVILPGTTVWRYLNPSLGQLFTSWPCVFQCAREAASVCDGFAQWQAAQGVPSWTWSRHWSAARCKCTVYVFLGYRPSVCVSQWLKRVPSYNWPISARGDSRSHLARV